MKYYQKIAKTESDSPQIYKRVEDDGSYKISFTLWVDGCAILDPSSTVLLLHRGGEILGLA